MQIIFFVHGLFGAHIHNAQNNTCKFPPKLSKLLGFKDNDSGDLTKVENQDYVPKPLGKIFGKSVYSSFCQKFNPINLTYDWRVPEQGAQKIKIQIQKHLKSLQNRDANVQFEIIILCHSLGGIITHNLLTSDNDVWVQNQLIPRLKAVVMMGSPLLGSNLYYDLLCKSAPQQRNFSRLNIKIVKTKELNKLLSGRENQYISFFCRQITKPINYPCILVHNRAKKTPLLIDEWQRDKNQIIFNDFFNATHFKHEKKVYKFKNSHPPNTMGDGVVPIIPIDFQFYNEEKVLVVDLKTKKNHAFLLNSKKVQTICQGVIAMSSNTYQPLKARLISALTIDDNTATMVY